MLSIIINLFFQFPVIVFLLQFHQWNFNGSNVYVNLQVLLHRYFLRENVLNVWPTPSFLMCCIRCKRVSCLLTSLILWKYKLFLRIPILISHIIFSLSSCFVVLSFCLYQFTFENPMPVFWFHWYLNDESQIKFMAFLIRKNNIN